MVQHRIQRWRNMAVTVNTSLRHVADCTAKTQQRKFETNIPRKGIAGLSPNFRIISAFMCPTIILPIQLQENMWTDPLGIYKSLTDT
jgi:hypothetical protein